METMSLFLCRLGSPGSNQDVLPALYSVAAADPTVPRLRHVKAFEDDAVQLAARKVSAFGPPKHMAVFADYLPMSGPRLGALEVKKKLGSPRKTNSRK